MATIFIKDDQQNVTVKISVITGGEFDYDYEHHNGKHFPDPPGPPFADQYELGNQNVGKRDLWTFRIIRAEDRDIDYQLHIEWWQDEKLMDEWNNSGTISKDQPSVRRIADEGKFKQKQ